MHFHIRLIYSTINYRGEVTEGKGQMLVEHFPTLTTV